MYSTIFGTKKDCWEVETRAAGMSKSLFLLVGRS